MRAQQVSSVEQARMGLGANLVLEGSLQRSGTRMRISYHLVDSRTRQQLRGDTVTAPAADPFAVEDHVVQSVLRSLDLELGSKDRQALAAFGTSEPAAYDYYLRGRGYLMEYQKLENVDSAIEVFKRALERDPNYALAYAGLGESYWRKFQATHASEWVTRALEACQKAAGESEGAICLGYLHNETGKYEQAVSEFQRGLDADRTSDDAYRGLAFAYEHLGKTAEAEQTYRRAIAVRPQYWAGYNWLGAFLWRQARLAEAAQMFQQVVALAPDNLRGCGNLGGVYSMLGRYEEAIPVLTRCLAIQPTAAAYSNLATVYFHLRRYGQAASNYEQALKLDGKNHILWGNLGEAYYWTPGQRDQAVKAYRQAISCAQQSEEVNPRDPLVLGWLAVYHAMLGESKLAREYIGRALALSPGSAELRLEAAVIEQRLEQPERALGWLEKAVSAGLSTSEIRNNPMFDNLRDQQRFQQLLRANPGREVSEAQKSSQ
ncbi:MAG: tetratricopeptide repeat protein [Terriglobales bacterium]